ncbi:MAG: CDGSH iron-sulfur domain-containing protein [Robiginitalea sp.]
MKFESEALEVEVLPKGPLIVKGKISLKSSGDKVENREGNTAFCRCGSSSNKPFCDGSHRKVDFE